MPIVAGASMYGFGVGGSTGKESTGVTFRFLQNGNIHYSLQHNYIKVVPVSTESNFNLISTSFLSA